MEFLRTKKRNLHGGIKACPAFGLLMDIDGLLWHHLGEEKHGGRHDWIPKARRFSENLEEKETSNSFSFQWRSSGAFFASGEE